MAKSNLPNELPAVGHSVTDAAQFLVLADKLKVFQTGRGPPLAADELEAMNSYRDWVLTTSKGHKP